MIRYLILFVAAMVCTSVHAQNSAIDDLFNKYSEQEGFTYVSISGKMLNLLGTLQRESKPDNIMLRLTSIKILSQEVQPGGTRINFFEEIGRKKLYPAYEELMVVKEGPEETLFLIRQSGDKISELLVISAGPDGNSVISIKGDLNLKELSELSETMGIEELENLEDYEGSKPE